VDDEHAPEEEERSGHRVLVAVLVFLGALLILISTVSVWVRDAALDTDVWVDQSGQLLESPEVQEALAVYIVDQAYSAGDVQQRLQEGLPEELQPLSGPIAAQLQGVAYEAAARALARPRVQELWRTANGLAHERIVAVLEGESERVTLEDGNLVLDLDQLVANVAERVGAGEGATTTLQGRVEPIVLVQSDELDAAQTTVRLVKALSFWPFLIGLALWAGAVYLAHGRRRETVRAIALSLVALGLILLVVRRIGGNVIVESLVQAESVKPAAVVFWTTFTTLLRESAIAGVVIGVLGLVWTWLSGPTRHAVAIREWLAPTFRDRPALVHGTLAAVILLALLWGPVGAPRRLISLVVFTALAFLGLELLRRQAVREFPDAVRGAVGFRAVLSGLPFARAGRAGEPAELATVERLERLAALRERGALTDEEYQAEKSLLLA
jgi:Short C-terminal domain